MKAKICLALCFISVMLLPSLVLAQTSFETKTRIDDGHLIYKETINGQTVEVETEGQTEIESRLEGSKFNVSVESNGTGKVKAEGEGDYEIESNGEKEAGSGYFSKFYEYFESFIFELNVIWGV